MEKTMTGQFAAPQSGGFELRLVEQFATIQPGMRWAIGPIMPIPFAPPPPYVAIARRVTESGEELVKVYDRFYPPPRRPKRPFKDQASNPWGRRP